MSVMPALYDELAGVTPILTNPFKMHSDFVYSNELGSKRRAILSVLIAAWMIDTHDELAPRVEGAQFARRGRSSRRKAAGAAGANSSRRPAPRRSCSQLAATDWKDPVKRTALVNRWQSEALDRYKSVLAQIASN